jgi:hypothetical protein
MKKTNLKGGPLSGGLTPPQQGCGITIEKVAPGGDGTEFPFEYTVDSDGPNSATLADGESDGGPFGSFVTVTELPLEGWKLVDIDCNGEGGITFDITANSFTAICADNGFGTCTFINQRVTDIPTLSEWGLIAMAGILGIAGFILVVRRRKVTA